MNKIKYSLNRSFYNKILIVITLCCSFVYSQSLKEVINGDHRSSKNKARDEYRHPLETLQFFGIKDNMTVVEIYPGGGWYQEILAPYLNKNGQYISATYDPDSEEQTTRDRYQSEKDRLSAQKNIYGNAKMVAFKGNAYGKASSADMILTFRNYHNGLVIQNLKNLEQCLIHLSPAVYLELLIIEVIQQLTGKDTLVSHV